ncbi:DNA methyltransferase [Microbispora bryophytorum]|uniref:DNA methyltransferase n=1 Tax=Microbispora bryophytorum TaxID=1460882 RepID=UPI0033EAAA64
MNNPPPRDLRAALVDFVAWRRSHLTGDEKGEAQLFCERLFKAFGHEGLREAGATLEARIKRSGTKGTAFADLMWKPRCIIEMKKAGTDLARHYRQAFQYWIYAVPDRPRYVVLCNFDDLWIYDFDSQLDAPIDIVSLADLPNRSDALAFLLPEEQQPVFGNDLVAVTREAAAAVSGVFRSIHRRGIDRVVAQRFVLQSVVAMFAEDIGLLPGRFLTRALEDAKSGADAYDLLGNLFIAMNTPGVTGGGRYAGTPYFNGGLFSRIDPIELDGDELDALREASSTNWAAVRPEIFGTLFETSMDAGERHAYGAHFTSQADIAKVVLPTIVAPWQEKIAAATTIADLERLLLEMATFRVLDPACGSGNFLYVAYRELRRLEHEVKLLVDDRRRSTIKAAQGALSYVTPDHFFGIDKNPFAVEVAKVTMMLAKKLAADELDEHQDVLPLNNLDGTIVARDALFHEWPKVHAIVGNPPYLGRRKMVEELGATYTQRLAKHFPAVGGVSDFVCYWFPLAHDALADGGRAGLVATQSVRETSSRKVSLDYVVDRDGVIVDAVSSQPWSGDAAVQVSIINWVKGAEHAPETKMLWLDNGQLRLPVDFIPASLKPTTDVRKAIPLACNRRPKVCFQGQTTGNVRGFRLTADEANALIARDKLSADFIHPMTSGDPLLHELGPTMYVIDLPFTDSLEAESSAPGAMAHLRRTVLPGREAAAAKEAARNAEVLAANPNAKVNLHHQKFLATWWRHSYRRDDLIAAIAKLPRYIVLTIVAGVGRKSIYQFVDAAIRPDASLQAFAFDDDYSFGILSSSLHRTWFDERCSRMKVDPRYTPTTVFDTFPWPAHPTITDVERIAGLSAEILSLRDTYLRKKITLAQQYDTLRIPGKSQLRDLHDALDRAVIEAYGLNPEDDILAQLLALNLAAAAESGHARRPGGSEWREAYKSVYKLTPLQPLDSQP